MTLTIRITPGTYLDMSTTQVLYGQSRKKNPVLLLGKTGRRRTIIQTGNMKTDKETGRRRITGAVRPIDQVLYGQIRRKRRKQAVTTTTAYSPRRKKAMTTVTKVIQSIWKVMIQSYHETQVHQTEARCPELYSEA